MEDNNDLQVKLQELIDGFTEFMQENKVKSVELEVKFGDPPRPEKIQLASNIQILDIKVGPEKKG